MLTPGWAARVPSPSVSGYIFLKYLHLLSVFTVAVTLCGEGLLLRDTLTRAEVRRISYVDLTYGAAAIIAVALGLYLWLGGVGRPAEFYARNWYIYLKIGIFSFVGILSLYPTVWYFRERKGAPAESVSVPASVRWTVIAEIVLLATLPLWAVLMVYG